MDRSFRTLALMMMTMAVSKTAHAQHCTPSSTPSLDRLVGVAGTEVTFATYRTPRFEGDYVGFRAFAGFSHPRVRLRASVPWYRLDRNGASERGIGDVAVDAEVALVRARDGVHGVGVSLAATLPTGAATRDLGMGHVMWMSGVWYEARVDRWFVRAQIVYGRGLMIGGSGHHGGNTAGPIVDPMNASELDGLVVGSYRAYRTMRIRIGAYGALPMPLSQGLSRAAMHAGIEGVIHDRVELGTDLHVAVMGDPFRTKVTARIGIRF